MPLLFEEPSPLSELASTPCSARRWERSLCGGGGEEWGGRYLEPVQIGMSGRFRYAVVRVVDAKGRQRYVVRGRARASPVELVEEVAAEVGEGGM